MQIDELYTLSKWYMKNVNSLNLPHVFANVNTVIKNTLVKKKSELVKKSVRTTI